MAKSKKPHDTAQLAKLIVDIATGEILHQKIRIMVNPAAVELRRLGVLKGGKSRG